MMAMKYGTLFALLISVLIASVLTSAFPVLADYCTPQWMNSYSCSGNYQTQLYQNPDCSQSWYSMQYCQYGCSNGNCAGSPVVNPSVYPSYYYYPSGCAASVSLTTPNDAYQGDFVSTTATITNIGGSSGTVNVNAYLCKADGTNCQQIYCGNSMGTSVNVPAHSAISVNCGVRTGYGTGYSGYNDYYNYYQTYANLPYTNPPVSPSVQPIYGPNYPYYCDGTYYSNYQLNPCYYNYQYNYYPYYNNYNYNIPNIPNIPTGSYRIRVDWSGCGISDPTMYTGTFAVLPYQACSPQYSDNYQCDGSWRQQLYQGSDCSSTYRNVNFCQYGCTNGACNQPTTTTTSQTTATTSTTSATQAQTATTTIIYLPTWPSGLFSKVKSVVFEHNNAILILLLLLLLVVVVIALSERRKGRAWIPWRGDEEKFSHPVVYWK